MNSDYVAPGASFECGGYSTMGAAPSCKYAAFPGLNKS